MREIVLQGRGPNTLSLALLESLERDLDAAGDEPVLLTGAGKAFSSGLDLDELNAAGPDMLAKLLDAMERTTRKLFEYAGPTVAFVNGHAVAGGCLLVQCCDVRIAVAEPRVRIGMTGVAIGLVYPPFVFRVLQHRVPPGALETVVLGSDRHDPREALRLGLVDEVVDGDARARAVAELERRALLPRHAYADAKRRLRAGVLANSAAEHQAFLGQVLPSWTAAVRR